MILLTIKITCWQYCLQAPSPWQCKGKTWCRKGYLALGFFEIKAKEKKNRFVAWREGHPKKVPEKIFERSNFLEWIQCWNWALCKFPMYKYHAPGPVDMSGLPEFQGRFCYLIWAMKKLWLFRKVLEGDYYTVFVDDIKPLYWSFLKNQYNGKEDGFSLLICLFETNQENTYRTCFS